MKNVFHTTIFVLVFLKGVDASPLGKVAPIFESPLGSKPVVERIELNGIHSLRVSFKTRASFEELEKYYVGFLKNEGWMNIEMDKALRFISSYWKGFEQFTNYGNQLVFIKDRYMIKLMYHEFHGRMKMFQLMLSEIKIPRFDLEGKGVAVRHVEGIRFPGSRAVVQYLSEVEERGEISFLMFKAAAASPGEIIGFFRERLLQNGWKVVLPWKMLKKELPRYPFFGNTLVHMDKVEMFRKGAGESLFVFTSDSRDPSQTGFGYIVKNIKVHPGAPANRRGP